MYDDAKAVMDSLRVAVGGGSSSGTSGHLVDISLETGRGEALCFLGLILRGMGGIC